MNVRVKTLQDNGSTDWNPEARKRVQWNVVGTIIDTSDSHGSCYHVLHPDGTSAWYERGELELM